MTKLKICTCKHEHQDKEHGKQVRVMNLTTKGVGDKRVYRCTVCKRES